MTRSFHAPISTMALISFGLLACSLVGDAKSESNDICTGSYGMYVQESGAETRPAFERFICQMHLEAPAKPAEFAGPAVGIEFAPAVDIGFQSLPNAALTDVLATAELVDTLKFTDPPKIDFATFSNLAQPASLTVGERAVWMVTPGGLRVFDANTRRWSFSSKISTEQVRPKDVVMNEQAGSVWFFGRDLFQYEISTHRIYRYKPPAKSFRVIRKLTAVGGGLWLATDAGVFFFDTRRKVLQQLQAGSKLLTQAFTQVAAGKSGIWFSSREAQLLRILRDGNKLSAQISKSLGGLSPIELVAREDGLWMLHSQDQGRSYQLATVQADGSMLLISRNKLYSLREADGQLLASAYDKLFRLDTRGRRIAPVNADVASIGSLALGKRVLFSGTSYVNSRGTGSVGRYVLDLSKGWQQPASRVLFEGWASRQGNDMFNYLPALLETSGNQREVWFLIAGNLSNPRFDRTFAARYDRRTGRAEVFFSRWKKDAGQTQAFAVESLGTSVTRLDQ